MSKKFEKALENSTDQTLVEPNWEAILECIDLIRGGDISAKPALSLIQRRYHSENPHVAHHALLVLEACVKNCGKKFHDEIATKEFMSDFKNVVIEGAPEKVSNKVLELIQCWSFAFREKSEYKIIGDTHSLLKMNGFDFPAMKEADAMFVAEAAPEWADGTNCFRCRTEFGLLTRKHHCRACGQVFCDKCSSYQMLLPHFGIEKKVRVCEVCYERQMKKQVLSSNAASGGKSSGSASLSVGNSEDVEKARLQEILDREQEELQLALAISQSEAEAKEHERQRNLYRIYNGNESNNEVAAITSNRNESLADSLPSFYSGAKLDETSTRTESEPPIDPNLAKYLDRDYWERKKLRNEDDRVQIRASAPPPSEISMSVSSRASVETTTPTNFNNTMIAQNGFSSAFDQQLNGNKFSNASLAPFVDEITHLKTINPNSSSNDDEVVETTQFCKVLKEQVDIMDNRMKSNIMRGRSIVNDSAIHSLFAQLTDLHASVMGRMSKLEQDREYFERLQDHIAHIQEARQAVNALREEHERQRQERLMEEQRQRQLAMQQKLEIMRVKKQEMLVQQRHLALQRFQEHEQQIQQRRMQQVPYTSGGYYVQSNYTMDPQQSQQFQGYASGQQVPMYYSMQYGSQPQFQQQSTPHISLHQQNQIQMLTQSPQIPNQTPISQQYQPEQMPSYQMNYQMGYGPQQTQHQTTHAQAHHLQPNLAQDTGVQHNQLQPQLQAAIEEPLISFD